MGAMMGRGPCTFRQKDVTRALKAARAAGVEVAKVEIDKDGKIVVVAGKPTEMAVNGAANNPWDEVLHENP
jgi:hypothetical protein